MRLRHATAAVALVSLTAASASAGLSGKGEIGLDTRAFLPDDEEATEDVGAALFSRLELSHKHRPLREKLRGYTRIDLFDEERNVLVIEEAWAEFKMNSIRLRAGIDIVNWTATEAFHPADVLNSRNLDSDIENYEKVGEPMVAATVRLGDGAVQLLYLPALIDPILPSPASRLSFAGKDPMTGSRAVVTRTERLDRDGDPIHGHFVPQGAVRLTQRFSGIDLGLHLLHHVDRHQPDVGFDAATFEPVLYYLTVTQAGGTWQQVIGNFVIKVEAAYRWFAERRDPWVRLQALPPTPDRDHAQVAVGIDYGLSHASGADSTVIVEAQSIFGVERDLAAELSIFQRDVLVGYRYAFNDIQSRELLATAIVDVERKKEALGSISYRQRLGSSWIVAAALRIYYAPKKGPAVRGLELLDQADHVRLSLTHYF